MTQRFAYEYAIIRVVPDIARGEFINAGVLLYSRAGEYLNATHHLDVERLRALHPGIAIQDVEQSLAAMTDCTPAPGESIGQRFRWLTTPRSTVVQTSPIHTGLAADLPDELQRLTRALA